jgi:ubiquinone biosynthesis protein Coq4
VEQLAEIRNWVCKPSLPELAQRLQPAMQGDVAAQQQICGALLWTAFVAPGAVTEVYDAIAAGAAGEALDSTSWQAEECAIPDSFWETFAETLAGPEQGYDATSITVAVAALGGSVAAEFAELAESAAQQHPGSNDAATQAIPDLTDINALGRLPEGSLGNDLYRMLVDNNFDAEVLDREVIGLANLTPALRYVNTRILQMHDVWHLVAGYQTTSLHEIAISAFQLAQFGHNYSSMFLATVATMSCCKTPAGFGLLMQNITEAWRHGRATPALMPIHWESEWHETPEQIRSRHGITPFKGSFPPDLLEQLAAVA